MSMLYSSESPGSILCSNSSLSGCALCPWMNGSMWIEESRTAILRRYAYGITLPAICSLGIVGNVLNLVVLTRRNMRGIAYIYMRGYSASALLAILFALPFAWRVLEHRDLGRWESSSLAFYHAHLELFLGNGCLGVGVIMLLALTLERYVSVCHPGHARPLLGSPNRVVILIPLTTFFVYLPVVFRSRVTNCTIYPGGSSFYRRQDVAMIVEHPLFKIYTVILEIVFKVIPIVLLGILNLKILLVYRKSCERRRRMTINRTPGIEDHRKFAEEKRLMLLLGSTSILFLVCVSPMVILNVTLSEVNLTRYPYQVFRALANLLEVTNYSITFYIYCMFSEDFRNTLLRTLQWSSGNLQTSGFSKATPPTATTTTTQHRSV